MIERLSDSEPTLEDRKQLCTSFFYKDAVAFRDAPNAIDKEMELGRVNQDLDESIALRMFDGRKSI